MKAFQFLRWIPWLLVLVFFFSCRQKNDGKVHHDLHSVLKSQKQVKLSQKTFPKALSSSSEDSLIRVEWKSSKKTFWVPKRTQHIQRFPCSSCHQENQTVSSIHKKYTHASIVLKHASKGVLKCTTCHNKDQSKLRLPTGEMVSFNQSYKLCSSCHSKQAKDWAGGSHGKRLQHWFGKRVIQTCTGCHSPHSPLFGKRWPKTFFRSLQKNKQSH